MWDDASDNQGVVGYKIYRNGVEVGTSATGEFTDKDLIAGTTYIYTIKAYDAAGNTSTESSPLSVTTGESPDTEAPTVPENVIPLEVTSTVVYLLWDEAVDNKGVAGYKIYRNGEEIGTSATGEYTDENVTAGTTYTYTIKAYDAAGNTSAESSPLSVTTGESPDTEAPTVPENVIPLEVTSTVVYLLWDEAVDNKGVAGYKIYRNGEEIGTSATGEYTDENVTAGTTYTYTIKAYDAAGNTSAESSPLSVTTGESPDTEAPTVPENVIPLEVTSTVVYLLWDEAVDNKGVAGYKIYRNGEEIGTSATGEYTDENVTAGTTYTYTIKAYDAAGNTSAESSPLSVTTGESPDTEAPTVPENVIPLEVTSTVVYLLWDEAVDNKGVAGYKIYRNGEEIGTSATGEYTDENVTAGTTYTYTIKAYDAAGNTSAESSPLSVTTGEAPDTQAPTVPENLISLGVTSTSVDIMWDDASDNISVAGYKIYRNGEEIGTSVTGEFTDQNLMAGTTYTYTIKAYDQVGNISDISDELTITTTV